MEKMIQSMHGILSIKTEQKEIINRRFKYFITIIIITCDRHTLLNDPDTKMY